MLSPKSTTGNLNKKFEWVLPIKTVSESNCSEHWSKKHKRHKAQRMRIKFAFLEHKPEITLPCHVKLIRIAPRMLDKSINLPMAFKWIQDAIADNIIPGLAPGRADGDPRITWEFDQEKGKDLGIKILVFDHQ